MEIQQTVTQALDRLEHLYAQAVSTAHRAIAQQDPAAYAQVCYPRLEVEVKKWRPIDRTEPYGYVDEPGTYAANLSRPRLMRAYLDEQLTRLSNNYPCEIRVGSSTVPIPPEYIPTAAGEPALSGEGIPGLPRPCLDDVDDGIIDGDWDAFHTGDSERHSYPLFHFSPQRFDLACMRIQHYTGISVDTVQRYILFSNYPMHTGEFEAYAREQLASGQSRYTEFVSPPGVFQMPRYDLVAPGGTGITMINIGVGPSNAKTITDCLAVLRPECWVMIGHCAGLDGRMRIGDLILGNAYQRRDHILDDRIPLDIPIPAIPEVQRALEKSVKAVYGKNNELMRTGTVMSTDDRNWEWHTDRRLWEILQDSTAVAVDMESATLAANGYRYRVPYGTLLSVSDLPLHSVPKLPAGAQAFYASSKQAHVRCALRAVEQLATKPEKLHTRKLRRTVAEVPFR